MLKNLLLILVLLPVLCFSQYEWTDKGDYKVLEYPEYIRQVGFSISGDSLLITNKQRIDIFSSDGGYISSIENKIEKSENSISFSSDMKSYILYDYKYHYDNADIFFNVYDFKDQKQIAYDSINMSYNPFPPNTTSFRINLIEYSTFYNKFYNNISGSSTYSHDINNGEHSYNFSKSMRYYFYNTESNGIFENESNSNKREQVLFDNYLNDTISYYYYFVKYNDISGYSESIREGKYSNVISFSKDEQLYALNREDTLFIYDINTGDLLETILLPFSSNYNNKFTFEFSSDNNIIYVATYRYLYVIDVVTKDVSRILTIPELERNAVITTHPTDESKLAIISSKYAFLCDIDFEAKPFADFRFDPNSWKITLQTIDTLKLFNLSIGQNLEYEWDFGDGNTSNEENPSHLYQNTGEYSVTLTVTNENGTDDTTHSKKVNIVEQQLFADFDIEYDESKFPIKCYLTDKSVGYNYSIIWYVNMEKTGSKDTTSFVINSPGKYPIELKITKGNFVDIKYDTVVIESNYGKIDNLVNERIINTNHNLETYNILEYDDNYYFNFVYDSIDIGYVSEIYKMDKDFDYYRQMRFDGYFYPPYEPTIYNDKLIFKYDSSLSMNDLSYLGTDFDGNIEFNYSQKFGENGSINFTENQINTTKLKIYNDSLYVLSTYGYSAISAHSYLYKINEDNYKPVLFDSLTYSRLYDTDFFINKYYQIGYSNICYLVVESPPYRYMENRVRMGEFQIIESRNWHNKIRLNDNWFSDSLIVALYCVEDYINKIVQYDIQNNTTFRYILPKLSKLNKMFRKGDSLYIAGSSNNEAAFYTYNLITNELDSVVLESRFGEFTDLRFNEKGNLVLFGKLYNNLNDNIYIAEYDFDLSDNVPDSVIPKEIDNNNNNFTIYPNPVTEDLLIQFESESAQDVVLKIYDIDGTFIQEVMSDVTEGDNQIHVKLKSIAKGVYILNVKTDKGIFSRKFVKE